MVKIQPIVLPVTVQVKFVGRCPACKHCRSGCVCTNRLVVDMIGNRGEPVGINDDFGCVYFEDREAD